MVSEEWAVELVERHVTGWPVHGPEMVITKVGPHRLGWVIQNVVIRCEPGSPS
ncbi:hypothetical protein [Amycolatopsis sp. NPDC052450]|uniref:hypothetical protein n=1 Tax=Amycolatopsis sp. NPDC052450 TaxID=3363937 RepID=UPI0037CBE968